MSSKITSVFTGMTVSTILLYQDDNDPHDVIRIIAVVLINLLQSVEPFLNFCEV